MRAVIKAVFKKVPALFLLAALLGQLVQANEHPDVQHETVTIWSGGIRLQGDLFKPADLQPGVKLPALLLVHGWGGTKDHLNRAYAPQFARLGFIVLTFDFKSWGESNGPVLIEESLPATEEMAQVTVTGKHIRRIVNPASMVEDTRAALNYLAGEPQVMANNIGIWGTSLGGGLALVTAANDDRIKAYVDQIGAVNFKANLSMFRPEMIRRWEIQRARGVIAPYPGAESVVNPALKGYPDWIYLNHFDSFAEVDKLQIPTLIIDAEDEELFAREVNGKALHNSIKGRLETHYVVLPGKHYDIYQGESYKAALKEASSWFVTHLKGDEAGAALYKAHCASCHSNPAINAPAYSSLRTMGSDKLLYAMTEGKMQAQAAALSAEERQTLASFLSNESKDPRAWEQTAACDASMQIELPTEAQLASWGSGPANHRHQPAEIAGMSASDLPELELAWAQGFPGATEMRSQPVIAGDQLFVGVEGTNTVYAFDLPTGCLHWVYRSKAPIRSALSFGRMPDTGQAVLFFGDSGGSVHLIDATAGTALWTRDASITGFNTITGTPVLHQDRLFVPVSSFEVARAQVASHECCREHGGLVALDISSGERLWTYETTVAATEQGTNRAGQPRWGPSGVPVWTTPAIDAKRNLLYIGTGENYSHPATDNSDAIVALDLDTGEPAWIFQALADDVYNSACLSYLGYPDRPNCPENPGPDFDFGASVIVATTSDGQDILLAGQKSGQVYALDPDNKGAKLWERRLSDGTTVGGIHWGMSLNGDTLYVPVADPDWDIQTWDYTPRPGVTALDVATGETKWQHIAKRGCELDRSTIKNLRHEENWPDCHILYGFSGATTSIDGAVLAGSLNGKLSAFNHATGELQWQYDTKRGFDTLNGVAAHGGSMDNAGPAVGNGYLVIQSGYSYINQMPGNLLLVLKKAD